MCRSVITIVLKTELIAVRIGTWRGHALQPLPPPLVTLVAVELAGGSPFPVAIIANTHTHTHTHTRRHLWEFDQERRSRRARKNVTSISRGNEVEATPRHKKYCCNWNISIARLLKVYTVRYVGLYYSRRFVFSNASNKELQLCMKERNVSVLKATIENKTTSVTTF